MLNPGQNGTADGTSFILCKYGISINLLAIPFTGKKIAYVVNHSLVLNFFHHKHVCINGLYDGTQTLETFYVGFFTPPSAFYEFRILIPGSYSVKKSLDIPVGNLEFFFPDKGLGCHLGTRGEQKENGDYRDQICFMAQRTPPEKIPADYGNVHINYCGGMKFPYIFFQLSS